MTIADVLDRNYERLQRQLLQLAEATPAESYSFKPTQLVRTFGEQLRHVGAVQWVIGAGLHSENPPVDVGDGDSGPLSITAKPELIKFALDSFAYLRGAIKTIDEINALETIPHPFDPANARTQRLALAVGYASHGWEHYGQMVVYRRIEVDRNSIL